MHDWLGLGLTALGLGLVGTGVLKRRNRIRTRVPAEAIRPEFAAMGAVIRPLVLCFIAVLAVKMSLFYFLFGGQRYLTPRDFAAILFLLAAYAAYLVLATTKPVATQKVEPVATTGRSAA